MKSYISLLFLSFFLIFGILGSSHAPQRLTLVYAEGEFPIIIPLNPQHLSQVKNWKDSFIVYVDDANLCCDGKIPVQGNYLSIKDGVTFQPDFPFAKGVVYKLRVKSELVSDLNGLAVKRITEQGQDYIEIKFSLPKKQVKRQTRVVQIYPCNEDLPENLLRFYIYFSSPMRRGFSDKAIKLVDEQDEEINNVFMKFKQELWSPDQQRLTVLFDPGRIKRGVSTNLELGSALQAGKTYRLLIDKKWLDENGNTLKESYEKRFRVIPALRSVPDPSQWKVTLPAANSVEPLTLEFNRPFDHALLRRMIEVDQEGKLVAGSIQVDEMETQWRFIPSYPWTKGKYSIHVDTVLEDIAGNNLRGLMDRPVENNLKEVARMRLPFKI